MKIKLLGILLLLSGFAYAETPPVGTIAIPMGDKVTYCYIGSIDRNENGNITNITPTGCTDKYPRFTDVPKNHWAYEDIESIVLAGIASGCSADKFCPDEYVTRAQMARFISNAFHLKLPKEFE